MLPATSRCQRHASVTRMMRSADPTSERVIQTRFDARQAGLTARRTYGVSAPPVVHGEPRSAAAHDAASQLRSHACRRPVRSDRQSVVQSVYVDYLQDARVDAGTDALSLGGTAPGVSRYAGAAGSTPWARVGACCTRRKRCTGNNRETCFALVTTSGTKLRAQIVESSAFD